MEFVFSSGSWHEASEEPRDPPVEGSDVAGEWGIFDTVEKVWIGDESGPRLFEERWLAKVAAQIVDVRIGQEPGTCREKPFTQQPVRLKDTVATQMDSLTALRKLESGEE